jgi:hypothetical protein
MIVERLMEREREWASMTVSPEADARIRHAIRNHAVLPRSRRLQAIAAALLLAATSFVSLALVGRTSRPPSTPDRLADEGETICRSASEPALELMSPIDPALQRVPIERPYLQQPSRLSAPLRKLAQRPSTPKQKDPELAIETIARLRAEHRYEEASRFIETQLESAPDQHTAELFMFELGSILEHQIGDPARACIAWRRYVARFPQGRYRGHAEEALRSLGCPARGNSGRPQR